MTRITGEMAVILDALGRYKHDSRVLDVVALVGPPMEIEEFDFDGDKSTHYLFLSTGTELVFENDVVEMVTVRSQPDEQETTFGQYPRPAALVQGLSPATATRAEDTALLGEPERAGPNLDRFEANNRYLHVEFDANNRIARLSALLVAI